jgi:DNA replication protein DnaC
MNTTSTLEQLHQLRLVAMAKSYREILSLPINDQPEANTLIALLTEQELLYRTNKKANKLLTQSKLRIKCHPGQISYEAARNLSKENMQTLISGHYITQAQNIIITGATGCGKSFIACALGHQACLQGYQTLYYNMNKLAELIHYSKLDGSYKNLFIKLVKCKLLILDDFGMAPLTNEAKLILLQIIEERYDVNATIIAAQVPLSLWAQYINEPTLADAILDRLTVRAHKLELKGESKRIKI